MSPAGSGTQPTKISLQISNSALICHDDSGQTRWTSNIDDIILIAEYTTDEGPYLDDYFFVFVTNENGAANFAKCTFYAEGRDKVLAELSQRFSSPLNCGLCNSTQWTSRVIWPAQLENTEYFKFTQVATDSFWSSLRKSLLGPEFEYTISDSVREYIRNKSRASPKAP